MSQTNSLSLTVLAAQIPHQLVCDWNMMSAVASYGEQHMT